MSDLIERLKEDAEHLEKLGWDAAMHDVYEAIAALSPVLPDEVELLCKTLKTFNVSRNTQADAADLIRRFESEAAWHRNRYVQYKNESRKNAELQLRMEELTEERRENGTALNNALLTLKEAQQRIEELTAPVLPDDVKKAINYHRVYGRQDIAILIERLHLEQQHWHNQWDAACEDIDKLQQRIEELERINGLQTKE